MLGKNHNDLLSEWQLAILIVIVLALWSAIFLHTFMRPFVWDDLHLIRPYSISELLSTFYGPNDPDHIETPGFRPIATMLFHLQGTLFGENMILQRSFMVILIAAFLWTVGLLLREVGLSLYHVVIVFLLFVSSRVFASLTLWLVMGSLLLAYTFMALSMLFYLRWCKQSSRNLWILMLVFTCLAAFTREEAYTLPIALPLIWLLSTQDRSAYRRPMMGALGAFAIVVCHYVLRSILITGAPQPRLNFSGVLASIFSAGVPGGIQLVGSADRLLGLCWILFLAYVAVAFWRTADRQKFQLVLGICLLGVVLSAPALAVPRSFGIALSALAFFTAIAVAVAELCRHDAERWQSPVSAQAVLFICAVGLTVGIATGVRRSIYVAQSLDENSVESVVHNGKLLIDRRVTMPMPRRERFMAYLAARGVTSRENLMSLAAQVHPSALTPPLFKAKYDYLSF
jgi:hypothetical protein